VTGEREGGVAAGQGWGSGGVLAGCTIA
jgi:hypothetical protein